MSPTEIIVKGTLNPDGTLQLDERPALSPGRVTVVLRQEVEATPSAGEGWWSFMQSARKKMEEAGCRFMDDKELQAHVEWLREGDHIDDLLREADEQRRKPGQP
jgi:hypothetical protein